MSAGRRRSPTTIPVFQPSSETDLTIGHNRFTCERRGYDGEHEYLQARVLFVLHWSGPGGIGGLADTARGLRRGASIVSLIKDSAAVAPIVTHKLHGNVSVLEGSGGNVAVLTGSDGKVLIDAGIRVSQANISKTLADLGADPVTHLINTHWHFDHADGRFSPRKSNPPIVAITPLRSRQRPSSDRP